MILIERIREDRNKVSKLLRVRGLDPEGLLSEAVTLDDRRKALKTSLDEGLNKRNALSKEIGELYRQGKTAEAESRKGDIASIKEDAQAIEQELAQVEDRIREVLVQLPNIPHETVPPGRTAEDNEVVREGHRNLDLPEDALPHWDLARKYALIDMELGVKITGSGFPVYTGQGALLQRSLINFFLDEAIRAGYREVIPPLLVNRDSAFATGQLPDKEGQMYHVTEDELYLIPTAEVPITNIYRDSILEQADLPVKMVGYTPCFRREAGSYGKDVRGLNRVHQFDKVEIVQIQHPDRSYEALEEMVSHVEGLLKKLELPYRIVKLCGGDLGFASAMTYDFEVWSGAQKRWLEVSSVSNFETFQSNRLKLRFRDGNRKTVLAHTLNGSALALARIVAGILENNQSAEGIRIPEVLRNYCRLDVIA